MRGSRLRAYIAAPFRVAASDIENRPYGVINDLDYRVFLETIARSLEELGIDAILPHRDKGDWGNCYFEPQIITEICFSLIQSSNFLVTLPGRSRGVHLEIGYATGMNKPMICFLDNHERESTLLLGLAKYTYAKYYRYDTVGDILANLKISIPDVEAFIEGNRGGQ